jgi:hypothetical protein
MPKKTGDKTYINPVINDLISLSEAAKISGFTTRHLRHLAENDELWAKKLGRNWFTTDQAIRDYLSRYRRPGPKPKQLSKII